MTPHLTPASWVRGAALVALAVTSCGGRRSGSRTHLGTGPPMADQVSTQGEPAGLELRVSSGRPGAPAFDHAALAPARRLSDAEAGALLLRAVPIATQAPDQRSFAVRASPQPAPPTGQAIKAAFPSPPSLRTPPAAGDAGAELRVERAMPEGSVPLAPELTVTFSQPMVAVTQQREAARVLPVKLSPQPRGSWRWIGARTIMFNPEVRFPQATTYSVEVPAGTTSANGGRLKQPVRFTFETPPPTMVSHYPSGSPQRLNVPMLAVFDQRIDPQAVLAKISVTAGGHPQPLRLADARDLAADPQLAALVESVKAAGQDGRWLAFRAARDFPPDATIAVEIAAGTPSAEGPNPTRQAQAFQFATYAPLGIERSVCGWRGDCRPGMALRITFNNPLDAERFDDSQLAISPAIPGVKIALSGRVVSVTGMTAARTSYTVTVSGGVVDELGQRLGNDARVAWTIGDAVPMLLGPGRLVVVDPSARRPGLDVFTAGYDQLAVQLYAVSPADYDAFCRAIQTAGKPPKLPGRKVYDGKVAAGGGRDQLVETHVDLAPALAASGLGHAIAIVEPYPWTDRTSPPPQTISWVQSTRLGIDAYVDDEDLVAFATELATGKPANRVALEILPFGITGATDDRGLATLALGAPRPGTRLLVARKDADVAFVPEDRRDGEGWSRRPRSKSLAWYVVDDRALYRPGEQVSLKGWLRTIDPAKRGDVGRAAGLVSSVAYRVTDATGKQIGKGAAAVDPAGGFDATFTLPGNLNLGQAEIAFEAQGRMQGSYTHDLQIGEFRRPELEVLAQASPGPALVGGSTDVTARARYFAGGPVPGAPVRWEVTAAPTRFTPPNRDDYQFGSQLPWSARGEPDEARGSGVRARWKPWSLAATTDATGSHTLHMDFLAVHPAVPMSVVARVEVTDVDRQAWSTWSELLVHPSSRYVGIKPRRRFVETGTPFEVDVIGVDLDGNPAPGARIEIAVVRLDRTYKKGKLATLEVDRQTCAVVAAPAAVPCSFSTGAGGEYRLTATIVDAEGRPNQTQLAFWVAGGDQPPARELAQDEIRLIPDRPSYAPGSTAELLVLAPFFPAEGVVTWRRSGIVQTDKITVSAPTLVIKVPISDAMVPNIHVQVDLVGLAARSDDHGVPDPALPKRPAYAVGTIDLPVPPDHRTLRVAVVPRATQLGPGETTAIDVAVADARGRPAANAEVAVIVVDEAVLALTGYEHRSPIETFYGHRNAGTDDVYSQAYLALARPDPAMLQSLAASSAFGDDGSLGDEALAELAEQEANTEIITVTGKLWPSHRNARRRVAAALDAQTRRAVNQAIALRSNFDPLAAFAPAVHTDAAGKATVEVKLPDNLTRYRVVAIAVAGDRQFGKGESAVTARLPLMVRPSPPRFLSFGDTFQLPVVVQNQTDAAMTVRLAMRATNATLTGGAGRELRVPANDRVEVRFPVSAELPGTARFQIVATASRGALPNAAPSDAVELALPVWTPATTETFATYGVIDDGRAASVIRQPVALPDRVVTQLGGLEVTTASTNLGALTDALLYLVRYPFECAEQRSSRILAIAALRDVLAAFHVRDMPSPQAMAASVAADIEHLSQIQNDDGGFAFWDRGAPSDPYLTVYVTSALAHARDERFAVGAGILGRAKAYLRDIERHFPAFYSKEVRWAISAYALYTRKQLGDLDLDKARRLITEAGGVDKLSMEANGWLLGTFAGNAGTASERKAIVGRALNQVSETAGAASFTTGYGDGNHLLLASDRRVDAVMLESLIQETSGAAGLRSPHELSDLVSKLVTGLLGHREAGRWLNTQENTFALLALDRYFQTYESTTPDFVARVWLGNDYAGDHAFKGRTTEAQEIDVAMKDVATHDKTGLTIQKDGKGRLYYRVGMTYAPASLRIEPADHGFVVERRYEAVDDPKDVTRASDGAWHIKAGARVRVRLTMVNESRRYHVALVDPLPAGLEAMNPELAVTGPIPQDPMQQQARGAYGAWYEHQNLRDERVEAFAQLLLEGVHDYAYVARATTPGNFVVPPPKAEEMYMPETFGRGASDRVVIE